MANLNFKTIEQFEIRNVNTGTFRDHVFAECDVYLHNRLVMTFKDDGYSCGEHFRYVDGTARALVSQELKNNPHIVKTVELYWAKHDLTVSIENVIEEIINTLVNWHDFLKAIKKDQAKGVLYATEDEIHKGSYHTTHWNKSIPQIAKMSRIDLVQNKIDMLLKDGMLILNNKYLRKYGVTC